MTLPDKTDTLNDPAHNTRKTTYAKNHFYNLILIMEQNWLNINIKFHHYHVYQNKLYNQRGKKYYSGLSFLTEGSAYQFISNAHRLA